MAAPKEETPKLEEPPPLPQTTSASVTPMIVSSSQVSQFKKILLPELYPLVRSGVIELEALSRTRYEWGLGGKWAADTKEFEGSGALAAGNSLSADSRTAKGFPFEIKDPSAIGAASEQNAYKILWNGAATQWVFPLQRYAASFQWFKQGKFSREIRTDLARLYPARVEGVTSGVQLFRERLSVLSPPAITALGFLTFRFLGPDEDLLWSFSPAINKARQLTGANRADSLLQMPVSLDDLFVWSGKHELVEATVQSASEALIPVAGLELARLAPGGQGCAGQQELGTRSGAELAQRWVTEGRSAWGVFSSLSYFVPRKVWRIELVSDDPFSLYGRQIVTVDQQSMAPVLKLVFDRSGHPWKLVMGSLGFAEVKGADRRAVVYPLTLVHDYLKDETVLMKFSGAVFCDKLGGDIPDSIFDAKVFSGLPPASSPETADKASAEKDSAKPAESEAEKPADAAEPDSAAPAD